MSNIINVEIGFPEQNDIPHILWDSVTDAVRLMGGQNELNATTAAIANAWSRLRSDTQAVINRISARVNEFTVAQEATIAALQAQLVEYKALADTQAGRIETLTLTQTRRSKLAEPPRYKGAEDKVKLGQWLDQMGLFFAHEGVDANRQRIVYALSRLEGPAQQYMQSYFSRIREGTDLGTYENFVNELKQIYGLRDEKEGAKKELEALLKKQGIDKDFIGFSEKFRTLGRLSGHTNEYLIDRLKSIAPNNILLVLASRDDDDLPDEWPRFLELMVEIYKRLNPNKMTGTIFGISNTGSSSTPAASTSRLHDAMDVDTLQKLSKEQEDWLSKKLCMRCGKHSYRRGVACKSPKYKGKYKLSGSTASLSKGKGKARINEIDEKSQADENSDDEPQEESDSMETLIAAMSKFLNTKTKEKKVGRPKKGKAKATEIESTARIEEVMSDEDFRKFL